MENFTNFFKAEVYDTYNRCIELEVKLGKSALPEQVKEYASEIKARLNEVKLKLNDLLSDPNLGHEFLIRQQLFGYNRLYESLSLLESYPITVLSRYNEDDLYFYNLIRLFSKNINYTHISPLATSFCMTHHASQPHSNLIIIPFIDRKFLLDLPFILHELGHIIFHLNENEFSNDFIHDLRKNIQQEKKRVDLEDRASKYKELYNDLQSIWEDSWVKEFVSDLIATYLLGPAYVWAYIRLCNRFSINIYYPGRLDMLQSGHPSDEARMRSILKMLDTLNIDSSRIREHWNEYSNKYCGKPPQEYEYCYPDHLLKSIIENVIKGCKAIGLKCYTDQKDDDADNNLILLVNHSMEKFIEDPEGYHDWELDKINKITEKMSVIS